MARPRNSIPSRLPHKASGQLRCRIDGRDYYCGPLGSQEAEQEYQRLVAEYLALQRQAPPQGRTGLSVSELLAAFAAWLRSPEGYWKHGRPTAEWYCYRSLLPLVDDLYGPLPAGEFGPLQLRAVREVFCRQTGNTGQPWSRGYVNEQVNRLRRLFGWGVSQGLVPGEVVGLLATVPGLRRHRSSSPEGRKVEPVAWELVEQTLPHLANPRLRTLVLVHRLLGCRAAEVVILRPGDLDRQADPEGLCWLYTPGSWKTEHHDGQLHYWLGPRGRALLEPLLEGLGPEEYVFGRPPGHRRTGKLLCHYTRDSYGRAIARACARAGLPHWSPGQIRHLRGTEVRTREHLAGRHGGEGAQACLSHEELSTTEVYAERLQIARRIQAEIG